MEMGVSVWLLSLSVPLAFVAVAFLLAAIAFAWGVRGQRLLTAASDGWPEDSQAAPDGRLERVYHVMVWAMIVGATASLTAVLVGLSALR